MSGQPSTLQPIGSLELSECASKLRELGEEKTARELERLAVAESGGQGLGIFGSKKKRLPGYMCVEHIFGFIAPLEQRVIDIVHAGSIKRGDSLKGSRIIITLDQLFVAEYPGGGEHRVLFDFAAQNHIDPSTTESLRFNMTVRARNGQQAPISGWPIFSGLAVGPHGIAITCKTLNVLNEDDEWLLRAINSKVFQDGLNLLTVAQPAIKPLAAISEALVQAFAQRYRNVLVQDFSMNLDFDENYLGARLAEGNYVAVQTTQNSLNWSELVYDKTKGQIMNRKTMTPFMDCNYIVFRISRMKNN